MNPLVLLLANGDMFFVGMAMVIVSLIAMVRMGSSVAFPIMRIVGSIGVILVLASSTPFPVWVYCLWFIFWLIALMVPFVRMKKTLIFLFCFFSIVLCTLEFPHRLSPSIPVRPGQHVYVLGDSISAGLGSLERNWPSVLGDCCHLEITNLSQPGATTASALIQSKGIVIPESLVIIEIGGNDLLGDTPSDQFSRDLGLLLNNIPVSSHCVMFELPLLPFHNGYGLAQRVLAGKYGVSLIPKKCLTEVIGGGDNTLDGLHLSQRGHNALAKSVCKMFTTGGF